MLILFFFFILLLSIYSYALVDPNLTLVSHPAWVSFREMAVQLGFHNREMSWYLYLSFVVILFGFFFYYVKNYKKVNPMTLAYIVGGLMLFSYPLLSHDFYNYIFDAKIFTYYGDNPYAQMPGDYPTDEWLRFMHWTHRSYPYGPTFLVLTIIPSFLAMGKFILNFLLFKLLFVLSYLLSVYILKKFDAKLAVIFALHPLVIVEGLINAHNDLLAVSLGLVGIYYLERKAHIFGRLFFILSAGIKFTTFPLLLLQKDKKHILNVVAFCLQIGILIYLTMYREIHPWYFLTLFVFLPIYPRIIHHINILLFGLLISHYPFIRFGDWDDERLWMKHMTIWIAFGVNILYILIKERQLFQALREVKLLKR